MSKTSKAKKAKKQEKKAAKKARELKSAYSLLVCHMINTDFGPAAALAPNPYLRLAASLEASDFLQDTLDDLICYSNATELETMGIDLVDLDMDFDPDHQE